MADKSITRSSRREPSSPAPQILQPTTTFAVMVNDGVNWKIFSAAARLLPPAERSRFALRVLGRLLDSPNLRSATIMSACDGALVECACATDKWDVGGGQ